MIETLGKPSENRQENDFYATNSEDVASLIDVLGIDTFKGKVVYEPCAGVGSISEEFRKRGIKVVTNDLIQRDYELDYNKDFMKIDKKLGDIVVTNFPFKFGKNSIKDAIEKHLENYDTVITLARVQILESNMRYKINKNHLQRVIVYSHRVRTFKNNDKNQKTNNSMMFGWFIYKKNKSRDIIIDLQK